LKTRKYEKDGNTRYITEIVAETLILLDNRRQKDDEEEFEFEHEPNFELELE